MRRSALICLLALSFLLPHTSTAAVRHWIAKEVGVIMAPDSRDCLFFKLVGVDAPEPDISNEAWIAIPRATSVGFKETYALLLWAKATGTPITVETSGVSNSTCGPYTGVWQLYTAY